MSHRPFPATGGSGTNRVQGSGKHPLDPSSRKRDTASRVVALDEIGEGHEDSSSGDRRGCRGVEVVVAAEEAGDQGLELAPGCQHERMAGPGPRQPTG